MVYLKLQPFRFNAFGLHQNFKLTTKYYGPFKIHQRIGVADHKLQLPESADIHPVFYVSQLKLHLGPKAVPQTNLPLVTPDLYLNIEPKTVLDTRALPRNDDIITQWLIQSHNMSADQSTWEDKLFIKATFLSFYYKTLKEWWPDNSSCGQEPSQGRGVIRPSTRRVLTLKT
jgi:hypothetical protein